MVLETALTQNVDLHIMVRSFLLRYNACAYAMCIYLGIKLLLSKVHNYHILLNILISKGLFMPNKMITVHLPI